MAELLLAATLTVANFFFAPCSLHPRGLNGLSFYLTAGHGEHGEEESKRQDGASALAERMDNRICGNDGGKVEV
jgi:hypothetical protein